MIYTHVLNRGGRGVRSPADCLGEGWMQEWRNRLQRVMLVRDERLGMSVHLLVRLLGHWTSIGFSVSLPTYGNPLDRSLGAEK